MADLRRGLRRRRHVPSRVPRLGVLDPALFARLYRVDEAQVRVFHCDPVLTIKITIPRASSAGGADETDFDGVQQFAPLLDVDVRG